MLCTPLERRVFVFEEGYFSFSFWVSCVREDWSKFAHLFFEKALQGDRIGIVSLFGIFIMKIDFHIGDAEWKAKNEAVVSAAQFHSMDAQAGKGASSTPIRFLFHMQTAF